jgi:hypothetical protein
MNRIEDERLKFYLHHQDLIDIWAGLAKLVPAQAHDFLVRCKGDLERLALELGADVECLYWDDDKFPLYGFFRPDWKVAPKKSHADWPTVGVGVQWYRPKVAFKGANAPWIGVWFFTEVKPRDELLDAFHSRCDKPREGFTRRDPWGAAVKQVSPPNEAYWDDLTPFKRAILDSIRLAWRHYSDDIPKIIRTTYP